MIELVQPTWIEEVWRPIPGYFPYFASSFGRLASNHFSKRRVLVQQLDNHGRWQITLCPAGGPELTKSVHQLIALTFHGSVPAGHEINHIDGRCKNNCAWNLEYLTPAENRAHAVRLGLHRGPRNPARGFQNARTKLSDSQVAEIRRLFVRREVSKPALAKRFGISFSHVKKLVRGLRR